MGKAKQPGLDFLPKALEVNWGFSISLALQGVIPSVQHHTHEQTHPELSLTPSHPTVVFHFGCTTRQESQAVLVSNEVTGS